MHSILNGIDPSIRAGVKYFHFEFWTKKRVKYSFT